MVHWFHELLNDIFYVLYVFVKVESFFETFIDTHDLRVLTEWGVVWVTSRLFLLQLFEDSHYEAKHAITFGFDNQSSWINSVDSKDLINFVGKILKKLVYIWMIPKVSILLQYFTNKFFTGNDIIHVKIFFNEL